MKICISTAKGGIEDSVYPLFGRAPTFTFVSVEEGKVVSMDVLSNKFSAASGGAGVQSAQEVIERSPAAVISGRFGPHAQSALQAAGIEMVTVPDVPVKDAVEKYLKDKRQGGK